jgi:hypothetical protein
VTTKNFKYYFSRKADATKMFERLLQLSQYSDVPDYENKVHTLLTSLISVTGTIGMKSYNKKLISMRVNTFDTPVIPYALSPYFVEIIN